MCRSTAMAQVPGECRDSVANWMTAVKCPQQWPIYVYVCKHGSGSLKTKHQTKPTELL